MPNEPTFPLTRIARILASVHLAPHDRADVLAASELDDERFEAEVEAATTTAHAAASRGDTASLDAWDDAYVARLEEERGALGEDDHARLLVGLERGDGGAACEAVALPPEALTPVLRVLSRRAGTDRAARAALRVAVARARSSVAE